MDPHNSNPLFKGGLSALIILIAQICLESGTETTQA